MAKDAWERQTFPEPLLKTKLMINSDGAERGQLEMFTQLIVVETCKYKEIIQLPYPICFAGLSVHLHYVNSYAKRAAYKGSLILTCCLRLRQQA